MRADNGATIGKHVIILLVPFADGRLVDARLSNKRLPAAVLFRLALHRPALLADPHGDPGKVAISCST
jgi:hypothetical protein